MKTCPICSAKAFDDAAVCYGCLHRFREEACKATDEVRQMPSGIDVLQTPPQTAAPAGATGELLSPDQAGKSVVTTPNVLPFDQRGWVVRFEFPGFVTSTCLKNEADAATQREDELAGGCSLLKRECTLATESTSGERPSCGLIVQFRPEPVRRMQALRRDEALHGAHACGFIPGNRPLASSPELA